MFGGDREAREKGDRAYYSLPRIGWDEIDPELAAEVRLLHRLISLAAGQLPPGPQPASEPTGEAPPSPVQLAFRLFEVGNRLWSEAAGEEQDLRQVITTLRTALAICWDLYTQREAERTSVAQLMTQLRERIEDFERDLAALQAEQRGQAGPEL